MIDDAEIPAPQPSDVGGTDEFVDKDTRFKFKRLTDLTPGASWILLIYGPSKAGKTYFAGTSGPRTLYINTGEGIDTLMSPAFTSRYPERRNMIVVDIREQDPNGVPQAFDMVTDVIDHAMKHFPEKFDTVVLDDATFTRSFAMNKAVELNSSLRTKGAKRANPREEYVKVDIGDYGEEMKMIEWFLSQYVPVFKGAQKHFICLAHERQIFAKPGNIGDEPVLKRIVPAFTGKTFPDKVPAYFDDVMHAEQISDASGNTTYRMRTAGNDMEMAGVRHGGVFGTVEPNPDFLKMLAKIKAAQPHQTQSVRR